MKKTLLLMIALVFCGGVMTAQKMKEIEPKKLPDMAHRTIAAYFQGQTVTQAIFVDEKMDRRYEVTLDDGTFIVFDKSGVWKSLKTGADALPQRMIPGMIQMYLQKNSIETPVVEMQKDKDKNFIIGLGDGTTLTFDEHFKLLE